MVVNTRHAEGQPEARQGAGRRLVRNAGGDARHRCEGHCRARAHGQGLGHRSSPASRASSPRRRCSRRRPKPYAFTTSPDLVKTMDLVRTFSFDARPARRGREVRRRGRHRVPRRQDARRREERQDALRPELHEDGGSTASSEQRRRRTMRRLDQSAPGRGGALVLGALPFILLLFAVRDRLAPAAGGEPGRQAAAHAVALADTFHELRVRGGSRAAATCCSGWTPGRASSASSSRSRISAAHRAGVRRRASA